MHLLNGVELKLNSTSIPEAGCVFYAHQNVSYELGRALCLLSAFAMHIEVFENSLRR